MPNYFFWQEGRIYFLSAKYLNSIPYEGGQEEAKEGKQTNPPEDSVIQYGIDDNDKKHDDDHAMVSVKAINFWLEW